MDMTYLKIFAYKSQEFLGNRHFLYLFPSKHVKFTFAPDLVVYSTIHIIGGCIIAAGPIIHRTTAISNWNLGCCRFNTVWLQAEFFEVSHSFNF